MIEPTISMATIYKGWLIITLGIKPYHQYSYSKYKKANWDNHQTSKTLYKNAPSQIVTPNVSWYSNIMYYPNIYNQTNKDRDQTLNPITS